MFQTRLIYSYVLVIGTLFDCSIAHSYELPPHPYPQTVLQVRQKLFADPLVAKELEVLLLKAARLANSPPAGTQSNEILGRIARELALLGNTREALSTARLIADKTYRNIAVASISTIMVQTDDLQSAMKLAMGEKDHRGWSNHLFSVIQEEIDRGYLKEAQATIPSVQRTGDRVLLLIWLAGGYLKVGNIKSAKASIEEALTVTPKLPLEFDENYDMPRDEAFVKIAAIQADAADWDKAHLTTTLIKQGNYRAWAIENIAAKRANTGDLQEGLRTADLLAERDYRSGAKFTIARVLESSGKFLEAIETLKTVLDDDRSANQALTKIALLQIKLGEHASAIKTAESLRASPSARIAGYGNPASGRNAVFEEVIRAKAKSGDIAGAKSLIQELPPERQWHSLEFIGKMLGGKEGIRYVEEAIDQAGPGPNNCLLELLALSHEIRRSPESSEGCQNGAKGNRRIHREPLPACVSREPVICNPTNGQPEQEGSLRRAVRVAGANQ